MACSGLDVEGKRIRVCKLREPREMVAQAADEVRRTLSMASPPDRSAPLSHVLTSSLTLPMVAPVWVQRRGRWALLMLISMVQEQSGHICQQHASWSRAHQQATHNTNMSSKHTVSEFSCNFTASILAAEEFHREL